MTVLLSLWFTALLIVAAIGVGCAIGLLNSIIIVGFITIVVTTGRKLLP